MNKIIPEQTPEIVAARARASQLLKDKGTDVVAIRSCWECNPAHEYFRAGEWGDWVLYCLMGCGRYFCDGVDITDYSEVKNQ